MSKKNYKSEDIRSTWRLFAGPAIGQLIGLIFGYFLPLDPNAFLSSWIGGAAGTGIGFWFGAYWHFKDPERKKKKPFFTIGFIGLISNALGIVALNTLFGGVGFANNIDLLKELKPEQVEKIIITKEYESSPLLIIADDRTINEFIFSCRDSKKYVPRVNYNPKITFSCFLEMPNAFQYGLSIDIFEGETNRVLCTFAKRDGRSISYYGTFESNFLRNWFDKYVVFEVEKKT